MALRGLKPRMSSHLPQLKDLSRRAADRTKDLDKLFADIATTTESPRVVGLKESTALASAGGDGSTHENKGAP